MEKKDKPKQAIPLRLDCLRKNVDGIFSLRVDIDYTNRTTAGSIGLVKGVKIDLIGDKTGSTLNNALYNVCVELSNMIQEVHYKRNYDETDKTG